MKKEDLIKRAREHGITLSETQAEKYINLSDEELENLAVAGGTPCTSKIGFKKHVQYPKRAQVCKYFELNNTYFGAPNCEGCKHAEVESVWDGFGNPAISIYCTEYDAWDGTGT
jgi:hypothetical protein